MCWICSGSWSRLFGAGGVQRRGGCTKWVLELSEPKNAAQPSPVLPLDLLFSSALPGVLDTFWQLVFGYFFLWLPAPFPPPFIYNYNINMAAAASVPWHWKELFLICSDEQQRQLGKDWHCARVDPCSWLWVSRSHLVQRKWSHTTMAPVTLASQRRIGALLHSSVLPQVGMCI